MHDIEEIAALLHIHEKAMAHGTSLSNIKDLAWQRLKQLNADHALPATTPPEPKPVEVPEAEGESNG